MTHIAGIGASAGGLEAMLGLFATLRATGRIRYVVAQHMAKNGHDELVVRLIQRESALPVQLATHGMVLQPDAVAVIPSGQDGAIKGNTLVLSAPPPEHVSTPSVNALFNSMAQSRQFGPIGIVLSGTGSDGTAGCRAIQAAGGLTLVQDPAEAKFAGMPQAAMDAKVVDQVLPVQQMGATLAQLFPGQPAPGWKPPLADETIPLTARPTAVVPDPVQRELQQLLRQVHEATGIDFSSYKEETLLRRLDKRKDLAGTTSAQAYQALIQRDPTELHRLQQLFLVSVSSFFRDADSFGLLRDTLGKSLACKTGAEPVRVWVAGCASGEEVYTLAIILRELWGDQRPVKIIGTDLNPEALDLAQAGRYRATAFKEMDAALRQRYLVARGADFEVCQVLRDSVQFERRDVLKGPPMPSLDLVSCRNLLIYLKSQLQDQLMTCFHQALRAQGLLFIGQSESLSLAGNALFAPVDLYHRLFRKRH